MYFYLSICQMIDDRHLEYFYSLAVKHVIQTNIFISLGHILWSRISGSWKLCACRYLWLVYACCVCTPVLMMGCARTMAHVWRSEDYLRHWSLPLILFGTWPLVCTPGCGDCTLLEFSHPCLLCSCSRTGIIDSCNTVSSFYVGSGEKCFNH